MLPDIRKILYCTDFSESSIAAFKYAVYLTKTTDAEIHILHVVEKLSNDAKLTFQTYVSDDETRRRMLKERVNVAQQTLIDRQDAFWNALSEEEQGLRHKIASSQVIESYPAETILKVSGELDADLVIMGSHERGLVRTFLGSVAKSVLRRSTVPVMVVPVSELQ
ncbi:universal stress protein [Granulosicoccus antarcticus]|uniref:Universal stress protein n=1 Tax=Granulosicoccus antarcticus IMCC3135 TaxID=1192854 RepID=A0A2Z2NR88_9GAMM|nr:universal stress protein [Granulosicoccus antarcticus]ASJ73853.1 Universal stress protein [Granulosicoccus antarcticus IMCC3135]